MNLEVHMDILSFSDELPLAASQPYRPRGMPPTRMLVALTDRLQPMAIMGGAHGALLVALALEDILAVT